MLEHQGLKARLQLAMQRTAAIQLLVVLDLPGIPTGGLPTRTPDTVRALQGGRELLQCSAIQQGLNQNLHSALQNFEK